VRGCLTRCSIFPPLSGRLFAPTVIYLPCGPILADAAICDSQIIATLRAASAATTIVAVNYRVDRAWPIPIHDVLAGYDWILARIKQENANTSKLCRIGACGQLLGGSLAAALSLTEGVQSVENRDFSIVATALNNPIVDWVVPDREALDHASKRKKKPSSWEQHKDSKYLPETALLKFRNELFPKPDRYFDSFASPIHLFRSAGLDVPPDTNSPTYDPETHPAPERRRKTKLFWPPLGSKSSLPDVRVTTGESSILRSQCEELIDRMRGSDIKQEMRQRNTTFKQLAEGTNDDSAEATLIADEAEKKYPIKKLANTGLWGYGSEEKWRPDLKAAAKWLNEALNA
jgi:acetyl esterase/lipase